MVEKEIIAMFKILNSETSIPENALTKMKLITILIKTNPAKIKGVKLICVIA